MLQIAGKVLKWDMLDGRSNAAILLLFMGSLPVAGGCSRSLVHHDGSQALMQSHRRASALATPVQKSLQQTLINDPFEAAQAPPQLGRGTQSFDVKTVSYEEYAMNSGAEVSANTTQQTQTQNIPRIPSHMLPASNMRPVSMIGIPSGQNANAPHGQDGCKCCYPQESYSPVYPQFSTRGDLSSYGPAITGCGTTGSAESPPPYPARYVDPQEYIYDGGDRDPEARLRSDLTVVGLDSEDTVIRYETTSGSVELQTGCRVPIYSPRFSAVRKIVALNLSEHSVATQATLLEQKPTPIQDLLPSNSLVRNDKPVREANVKVIESFRDRNRGIPVAKIIPANDISDALKPTIDLTIVGTDLSRQRDIVQTQSKSLKVLIETQVEQLVVLFDNVAANVVESLDGPQELYNYELGNSRVRLCKAASHQVAEPGDIVDFTIRFDNTGDQKITNIMIQDSLAPRFEYIVDSQKSSIESKFSMEPNDAGSSTLTWNITETVAPGTGGFIRFQCKVR